MFYYLLSRRTQPVLLFLASLAFSISGSSAQAKGNEPSELYAIASDGTPLHWTVYTPEGTGPWSAVLVIHPGCFVGGSPTTGPDMVNCSRELAAAGFIVFSIEYRLAPDGKLVGQVSDGRFPDQSDDTRLAVLAARADPRCNGKVGAVGGSSGGYQAAFTAGTGTPGQDRIDVGVSLSGAYDLSDFSPNPNLADFVKNVTNYVGVAETDVAALQNASPVYLIDSGTVPLFLVHSSDDPMPYSQLADMTRALDALGVTNYWAQTIPGYNHAFANWETVKDSAISFLAAGFAGVPPPPPPFPTPTPSPSPGATPGASATPTPAPVVEPSPTKLLLNVSTRVRVESGSSVMIGGFIVTGDAPKKVALRAIGPSLASAGLSDVLADPVLELHDATGALIAQNDNCSSLPAGWIPANLKPSSGLESFISTTLQPGSYTAVLRSADSRSGVALFELYDLDPASSRIANISTRGEVGTDNDIMIGGFIVGGTDPTKVILRAIGPSLVASGIQNALPDPVLSLFDGNGSLVFTNDNWRSAQENQIIATGVSPNDDHESAIVATLSPGNYTATVSDSNHASGVALVEVYDLETQ
jgi:acetyl esterase/lipase